MPTDTTRAASRPLTDAEIEELRAEDERLKWEGETVERLVPVPRFATERRLAYPNELAVHRLLATVAALRAAQPREEDDLSEQEREAAYSHGYGDGLAATRAETGLDLREPEPLDALDEDEAIGRLAMAMGRYQNESVTIYAGLRAQHVVLARLAPSEPREPEPTQPGVSE